MFAWNSWHTLVPLFIGAAGIVAFGFYEYRLSAKAFDSEGKDLPGNNIQPIIRFSIFNNWTLRLLYLQTLVHGMILWSLLYFLPLYYEGVKGYTPIVAGVAVLPETVLIARKFHFIHTWRRELIIYSNVNSCRSCKFHYWAIHMGELDRLGSYNPRVRSTISPRPRYKHPRFHLPERPCGHWNRHGFHIHVTRNSSCWPTSRCGSLHHVLLFHSRRRSILGRRRWRCRFPESDPKEDKRISFAGSLGWEIQQGFHGSGQPYSRYGGWNREDAAYPGVRRFYQDGLGCYGCSEWGGFHFYFFFERIFVGSEA